MCTPGRLAVPTPNCMLDDDCTAGTNGRCLLSVTSFVDMRTCTCSYDTCTSDTDCTGGPCHCSAGPRTDANACRPGNCQVDADCGPGGYCSPTRSGTTVFQRANIIDAAGYYCHTAMDTCVDDSDCVQMATWGSHCAYDLGKAAWTCRNYLVE